MLVRRDVGRALEEHVLEQMREPGAARTFVRRANMIPQVHRDERRRVVLGERDEQPVWQSKGVDGKSHSRKLHLPNIQREPRSNWLCAMVVLTLFAIVLVGGLMLVSAMVGGVWWQQERIAYQPPRDRPVCPPDVRKVEYVAPDDQRLLAYIVEPDGPPRGLLLGFHGNADLAAWQIPWGREVVRRTGWCVALAEYRGYGGLGGTPTYGGIREDARAAWTAMRRFAHNRFGGEELAFALFGHSLGSAVATELAHDVEADHSKLSTGRPTSPAHLTALVLQAPFTSARDMARIISTRPVQVVWNLIARVHYDSRMRLSELAVPTWVAHGSRDWIVPVWMGRDLFARVRSPGRLLIVDGAGHNDVAILGGERYWDWLSDALGAGRADLNEARSTFRTETPG